MAEANGGNMLDKDLIVKMVISLAVVAAFINFITADAIRAWKRRAHWVPSDLLALSALTILLLNFLSDRDDSVKETLDSQRDDIIELWMVHSSRVMVCVVLAYLLPGMASLGSESLWRNLIALIVTIFVHMFSELYKAGSSLFIKPQLYGASSIYISFIMLILLLGCAHVASRGIEGILAQKIPIILSKSIPFNKVVKTTCNHSNCLQAEEDVEYTWQAVEDEVFKAWIVAHAYSPEYIIAKSALCSSAAAIVTVQIVISTVGLIIKGHRVNFHSILDCSKFIAAVLQCVFILIGWAIIGWRWCTSVGYYGKWRSDHGETCYGIFRVEDFWTRHIKELQAQKRELPEAKSLSKRVEDLVAKQPIKIKLPGTLLHLLLGIQWLMALFSKTCWALSLMVFHNRFVDRLIHILLSNHIEHAFKDFPKYEKVLEDVQMMGETPRSLWLANRKTIAKAKQLIKYGEEDGVSSKKLIEFLTEKKTPTSLEYLYKLNPQPLEVEKYFMDVSKHSWKMKAMSLISLGIKLSPQVGKNCLEVYSQAWEVLDFVEKNDAEAEGIMEEAADRFFYALKESLPTNKYAYAATISPAAVIKELAMGSEKKAELSRGHKLQANPQQNMVEDWETDANMYEVEEIGIPMQTVNSNDYKVAEPRCNWDGPGGNDSIDWKEVAAATAVYKLCESIDCNLNMDINVLLKEIECLLANIICACLHKIKSALIVNSSKWARDIEENKLGRALYTAGKAKALMEKLDDAAEVCAQKEAACAILNL
ncbi:uncharacterized protein LOC131035249 [Cryptomeria japonica]|uniref:uncharacterized protein LOC131035249 n=1 Tax=Cryptomeria japonica TaxID=3369 RepID=UPI0025ABE424|nr:uncharacterized protein LOC131035249 [Cryptomeria japonica]